MDEMFAIKCLEGESTSACLSAHSAVIRSALPTCSSQGRLGAPDHGRRCGVRARAGCFL